MPELCALALTRLSSKSWRIWRSACNPCPRGCSLDGTKDTKKTFQQWIHHVTPVSENYVEHVEKSKGKR